MTKTIGLCLFLCAGAAVAQVAPSEDAFAPSGPSPFENPVMPGPEALGDLLGGPFNTTLTIPSSGALGAEYAWGHVWVSARNGSGAAGAPVAGQPNRIAKFTPAGVLVRVYNQGSNYDAALVSGTLSPWGGRDGAADEANNKLYFGHEQGWLATYNFNPITGDISHAGSAQIPGIITVIRALCIRADNGNFLCGDFNNVFTEFRTTGVVAQYPNNLSATGGPVAVYGFAWSHDGLEANDRLWAWSQPATLPQTMATEASGAGPFVRTGREFVPPLPAGTTAALAGGADADCEGGNVRLLVGVQGTPDDYFAFYDLDTDCGSACPCACNYDTSTGQNVCDIFDFLGFQNRYDGGDPCACDTDVSTGPGVCDIFDFLGFQNNYTQGCP